MKSFFAFGFFQAAAALALFAGLVQRSRDLIVIPALILATVNAARLMSRWSARRLSVQVSVSRSRLYPGEELALSIGAANRKLMPVWVKAEIPQPVRLAAAEGTATRPAADILAVPAQAGAAEPEEPTQLVSKETGLLWHQRVLWEERLVALRRGVCRLGPIEVEAGDILGFFNRRNEPGKAVDLIVYPRLVDLAPLPVPVRDFFGLQSARTPVEDPVNNVGTRDYDASGPSRHIHWKASARLGRLQQKEYEPTSQASVLLLVDAVSFADPPPIAGADVPPAESGASEREQLFERALEAAASLAVRLEAARVPVGLAVNGALAGGGPPVLPAGRGPYQVGRLLEILARLTRTAGGDETRGNDRGLDLPITGGTTCVVFYRQRSELEALRHRLRTVVVLVPAGEPPEGGFPLGVPVIRLAQIHPGAEAPHG